MLLKFPFELTDLLQSASESSLASHTRSPLLGAPGGVRREALCFRERLAPRRTRSTAGCCGASIGTHGGKLVGMRLVCVITFGLLYLGRDGLLFYHVLQLMPQ